MLRNLFKGSVRLAGGLEVADRLKGRPPIGFCLPDGSDSLTHADIFRIAADQMKQRCVRTVEEDPGTDVGGRKTLAWKLDSDD